MKYLSKYIGSVPTSEIIIICKFEGSVVIIILYA